MEQAVAVKEEMTLNIADIRKFIAPKATEKELFMFMGIAKSYGLNPLKREIHFVKYGENPASIIVGYETYLKRAERTGKLDGWKCWLEKDDIGDKAVIEIKRKDHSLPIRWEVYRKEFDKGQSTWKSMPYFMLKKVAIAQGFRLAFPDDLGGMPYIPEELPQTSQRTTSEELPTEEIIDVQDFTPPSDAPADHLATKEQITKIQIIMKERGITERQAILNDLTEFCQRPIHSSKELTAAEAHEFISASEK